MFQYVKLERVRSLVVVDTPVPNSIKKCYEMNMKGIFFYVGKCVGYIWKPFKFVDITSLSEFISGFEIHPYMKFH